MRNTWTNGCFDILHLGHLALFEYAKSLGDTLTVGIDSDNRIKRNKGDNRPFHSQEYRLNFLSHIKHIDRVVIFNSDEELINSLVKYSIDTIVIGDDYINKPVIGREFVQEVVFFPKIPNLSSSKIYESIRRS